MDPGSILLGIVAALFLVFLNGFFVASEFAIVKVRGTQLAELVETGGATARLAQRVTQRLDAYLAACQVGITIASLGLGWIGEPAIASLLEPPLEALIGGLAPALSHALAIAVAFLFISSLHIVLGELMPKSVAIQRALVTTLWVVWPLHVFYTLAYPFIWALNGTGNALLRLVGLRTAREAEHAHSPDELRLLVDVSGAAGTLDEGERELLQNVLGFHETIVRQVMVPRTEMVAIASDATCQDLVELAERHPFTRFPVFRDDLDHVIGLVHVRDLVGMSVEELRRARVTNIMRPIVSIPETMALDRALAEMRRQRSQQFVVVDEFGGTAGLVTMEDVLEELVGEVQDEFDRGAPQIRSADDGTLVIDGLTALTELGERLPLELEDEPYDTVGGLVFGRLGRVARVGDAVEVQGVRFEVTAMDGRRIAQVRARPLAGRPRGG